MPQREAELSLVSGERGAAVQDDADPSHAGAARSPLTVSGTRGAVLQTSAPPLTQLKESFFPVCRDTQMNLSRVSSDTASLQL